MLDYSGFYPTQLVVSQRLVLPRLNRLPVKLSAVKS